MPASCAATEMTKTGASSGTFSRLGTVASAGQRFGDLRARIDALRGRVLLPGFARVVGQRGRSLDLAADEQVARRLLGPDAATAYAHGASGRRPRSALERYRA